MKSIELKLPSLPYEYDDLDPVISPDLLQIHHQKHHQGYVNKANNLLKDLQEARENESLLDMKSALKNLSFSLNGHTLHDLFWKCMRKHQDNNVPKGKIADLIQDYFGDFERFKQEFSNSASSVEGSGWMGLALDDTGNLLLTQIENHQKNHLAGTTPILVLDVWEHAYYLDYANDRGAFIESWWDVVNWDYVNELL
jgi:Fe-Mn family superoxide dismutase